MLICEICGKKLRNQRTNCKVRYRFCSRICRLAAGRPEIKIPQLTDKTPGYGPWGDCWHWKGSCAGPQGYESPTLYFDKKPWVVARLVYEMYNNHPLNELNVLHKCDNRKCINPDHLFAGTQKDNMQDCKSKGRMTQIAKIQESNVKNRKLTPAQAKEIREIRHSNPSISFRELGEIYGVSYGIIGSIIRGKCYKEA